MPFSFQSICATGMEPFNEQLAISVSPSAYVLFRPVTVGSAGGKTARMCNMDVGIVLITCVVHLKYVKPAGPHSPFRHFQFPIKAICFLCRRRRRLTNHFHFGHCRFRLKRRRVHGHFTRVLAGHLGRHVLQHDVRAVRQGFLHE